MDPISDDNDAAWHEQELNEQRMLEEDPAYLKFLRHYEENA